MRGFWVVVLLAAGCGFEAASQGSGGVDAPLDTVVADAGPCQSVGKTCAGDSLRDCKVIGEVPDEKVCPWGCASARCSELAPGGGWWQAANADDTTNFNNLDPVTLPDGAIVNGSTGEISGAGGVGIFRDAGTGEHDEIVYELRPLGATGRNVAVFKVKRLTAGALVLRGAHAIAFIADKGMDVTGVIDARGPCTFADARTPGPGGFSGGINDQDGQPTPPDGGGKKGPSDNQGGGGGGHGALGGDGGGNVTSGGALRGDLGITQLIGGAGGGGGDSHSNSGLGGGGGAALQLIANGPIQISAGGINAGGCGGRAGLGSNDGGGGGGAGGAILIEAPTVVVAAAVLAVNGGGGGGGAVGNGNLTIGQSGQLSQQRALGGPADNGSAGGLGGASPMVSGAAGAGPGGGGGGGGVGRIRISTRNGSPTLSGAILSPGPGDAGTTYSEGVAGVR